jgi:hypothetical protein
LEFRSPKTCNAEWSLAFDQAHIAGARSFLRFFWRELDSLTLTQEFEDSAADRATVKKVLDAAFVPDEPKSFVD